MGVALWACVGVACRLVWVWHVGLCGCGIVGLCGCGM